MADIAKNAWKPVIATWMGAEDVEEGRHIFVENSIPAYDTPEEAVRMYVNMCRYKRHLDQLYETPGELPSHKAPSKDHLKELIDMALKEGRTLLNEEESEEVRADVLTENEGMLKIFRRLGFTTHWVRGGTSEAVLKLK